jgi:hypothetical protein
MTRPGTAVACIAACALLLLAHCGGSTATPAEGASEAGADGGGCPACHANEGGAGGHDTGAEAGGCPDPSTIGYGTPCTQAGLVCAANNVFCEAGGGGRLQCDGTRFGEAPGCAEGGADTFTNPVDAGSFTCGNTTCAPGEYCTDHPPGIAPGDGGTFPDAYMCEPTPASCASSPTCGCIESTIPQGDPCSTSNAPGVTCTADPAGHVTIHCLGV